MTSVPHVAIQSRSRAIGSTNKIAGLLRTLCLASVPFFSCKNAMMPNESRGSHRCTGQWSAPASVSQDRVARFATTATNGSVAYVIGDNVPYLDSLTVARSLLTIAGIGTENIGGPPGDFAFAFPKAAFDGDGHLHLLWAEPKQPPVPGAGVFFLGEPLGSIWTSTLSPQDGWESPRLILQGDGLVWLGGFNDRLASENNLLGVVSGSIGDARFLFFDGAAWHARPMPDQYPIGSTAIVRSVIYLARLAAAALSDRNSVVITRSTDSGATWAQPTVVSLSGKTPAEELRLRATPDGVLHLVWGQMLANGGEVIRHRSSTDGGLTWSKADDFPAPEGFNALQADFDSCDGLHVVFEHYPGDSTEGHVDHTVWNGGWSATEHLFTDLRGSEPNIRKFGNSMLLTFMAQAAGSPLTARYSTMRATWSP